MAGKIQTRSSNNKLLVKNDFIDFPYYIQKYEEDFYNYENYNYGTTFPYEIRITAPYLDYKGINNGNKPLKSFRIGPDRYSRGVYCVNSLSSNPTLGNNLPYATTREVFILSDEHGYVQGTNGVLGGITNNYYSNIPNNRMIYEDEVMKSRQSNIRGGGIAFGRSANYIDDKNQYKYYFPTQANGYPGGLVHSIHCWGWFPKYNQYTLPPWIDFGQPGENYYYFDYLDKMYQYDTYACAESTYPRTYQGWVDANNNKDEDFYVYFSASHGFDILECKFVFILLEYFDSFVDNSYRFGDTKLLNAYINKGNANFDHDKEYLFRYCEVTSPHSGTVRGFGCSFEFDGFEGTNQSAGYIDFHCSVGDAYNKTF